MMMMWSTTMMVIASTVEAMSVSGTSDQFAVRAPVGLCF